MWNHFLCECVRPGKLEPLKRFIKRHQDRGDLKEKLLHNDDGFKCMVDALIFGQYDAFFLLLDTGIVDVNFRINNKGFLFFCGHCPSWVPQKLIREYGCNPNLRTDDNSSAAAAAAADDAALFHEASIYALNK